MTYLTRRSGPLLLERTRSKGSAMRTPSPAPDLASIALPPTEPIDIAELIALGVDAD